MEERKAPVSLPYPHTASPEESPQRRPLYAQTHPNKHSHVSREAFSLSLLSLPFFFPFFFFFPPPQRRTHGTYSFSKQRFPTCLSSITTQRGKGMRGSGERKRRREERCSKSQEGGIYVDVGEIHHPPSLHWLFFFFFFITEGKQGPPQSLPHHHKYGCLEECAGEA